MTETTAGSRWAQLNGHGHIDPNGTVRDGLNSDFTGTPDEFAEFITDTTGGKAAEAGEQWGHPVTVRVDLDGETYHYVPLSQ
jgi:hypothetical protein